jgi:hypothetical protein
LGYAALEVSNSTVKMMTLPTPNQQLAIYLNRCKRILTALTGETHLKLSKNPTSNAAAVQEAIRNISSVEAVLDRTMEALNRGANGKITEYTALESLKTTAEIENIITRAKEALKTALDGQGV